MYDKNIFVRYYPGSLKGFTILEVMVALVIMGISIGVFFSLIGKFCTVKRKNQRTLKTPVSCRDQNRRGVPGTS